MFYKIPAVLSLFLVTSLTAIAADQSAKESDNIVHAGYARFVDSCAFCHSIDGKGDGDASELLSIQPADLTQLSKNNKGEFPLEYVYNLIDGRKVTLSHGLREMPVWGELWAESVPPEHAESYVRSRILEIIMYLESIQE